MPLFRRRPPANVPQNKTAPAPVKEAQPLPPVELPEFLRDGDIRTSLAPDAIISGKLSFTTPTRIEGKLKGELRCTQLLIIGPSAVVEGWVKADELHIEGTVRGEIAETRKVEILHGGRFFGRLQTQILAIRDGGFFDGECRMRLEEGALARNKA